MHISGGEPLARRDVTDIVRAARSSGLYVNLITAAVNLTAERADALVEAGVEHVQISLQDATEEGCNRITNYSKAFQKKLESARLVTERGLPLTINAVVHRQNLDRVADMIELALSLGAHRIEIANTQYYGWALRNRAALMPEPHQVEAATAIVSAARERLKGRMLIDYVAPDYYAGKYPKPCMGGWGRQIVVVTPSGQALPCHAAQTIPGLAFDNLRDKSLGWIWRRSERLQPLSRHGLDARALPQLRPAARGLWRLPLPGLHADRERRGDRPGLPPLAASCRAAHDHRRHDRRPRRRISSIGATEVDRSARARPGSRARPRRGARLPAEAKRRPQPARHSNKR